MTELLERISAITQRDMLHDDDTPREETSPTPSPESRAPQEQTAPPSRDEVTQSTSSAESRLLNRSRHSNHQVTPAVTRAGIAARSFRERNTNNDGAPSAHLAATVDDKMLSELRRLQIHTNALLPDVAHQKFGAEAVVEYAYTTTNHSSCRVGGKTQMIPNTFHEAMDLPDKEL